MINPVELSQKLIQKASISPNDAGCQQIISDILTATGFNCIDLSSNGTRNLYATFGDGEPTILFAGHTDVVPAGENWKHPAFAATIAEDKLYGRGTVDMKTALAAMISTAVDYAQNNPNPKAKIGFAITSDEEGSATDGSTKIVDYLMQQNSTYKYVIIGEPSSKEILGDTCKIGRRGSLHAHITIHGKQGHIAYPQHAINPIHLALNSLHSLCQQQWDQGDEFFPATQLQISNINSGTGALNIIPEKIQLNANFRFCPQSSFASLQQKTEQVLQAHDLNFDIDWHLSAKPFYFPPKTLAAVCKEAIANTCNLDTVFSTDGGTSDGRFFQHICNELIEIGMPNKTAHQVDEHCLVDDVNKLHRLYQQIMTSLLQ